MPDVLKQPSPRQVFDDPYRCVNPSSQPVSYKLLNRIQSLTGIDGQSTSCFVANNRHSVTTRQGNLVITNSFSIILCIHTMIALPARSQIYVHSFTATKQSAWYTKFTTIGWRHQRTNSQHAHTEKRELTVTSVKNKTPTLSNQTMFQCLLIYCCTNYLNPLWAIQKPNIKLSNWRITLSVMIWAAGQTISEV